MITTLHAHLETKWLVRMQIGRWTLWAMTCTILLYLTSNRARNVIFYKVMLGAKQFAYFCRLRNGYSKWRLIYQQLFEHCYMEGAVKNSFLLLALEILRPSKASFVVLSSERLSTQVRSSQPLSIKVAKSRKVIEFVTQLICYCTVWYRAVTSQILKSVWVNISKNSSTVTWKFTQHSLH
jgi:hypothetical protein